MDVCCPLLGNEVYGWPLNSMNIKDKIIEGDVKSFATIFNNPNFQWEKVNFSVKVKLSMLSSENINGKNQKPSSVTINGSKLVDDDQTFLVNFSLLHLGKDHL